VVSDQELTSWLKARIHLRCVNGKMVKHGIQEVWHEVPNLEEDGYHTVERDGKQIKYKLLRSPYQYRAKYYQGIKHGIHFLAEMDYKNNTVKETKVTQFQNGKIKTSRKWYHPSGKQKSYSYLVNNIITKNNDTIIKDWYESGEFSYFSYTDSESIHSTTYDKDGKVINNLIRNRRTR
jgi:hypothetical protein